MPHDAGTSNGTEAISTTHRKLTVVSAKLSNSSGGKPDTYVSLVVDGRTESKVSTVTCRKTLSPSWNDAFTLRLSDSSTVEVTLMAKSMMLEDVVMGVREAGVLNIKDCKKSGTTKIELFAPKTVGIAGKKPVSVGVLKIKLADVAVTTATSPTSSTSNGTSVASPPRRPNRPPRSAKRTSASPAPCSGDASGAGTSSGFSSPPSANAAPPSGKTRDTLLPTTAPTGGAEEPLPSGWEVRHDQFGRPYYVDHTTKSTTWERPSNAPLPVGWELRRDPRGRVYYVDHNKRSTSWQRPTADLINAHQQWAQGRDGAMRDREQRFLFHGEEDGDASQEPPPPPPPDADAVSASPSTLPPPTADQTDTPTFTGVAVEGEPLPNGWEKRIDPTSRREYYVNHMNRTTQWEDPRTVGTQKLDLPPGWEMRFTEQGVPFFIDHNTKTTTYNNPITGKPVGPVNTFRWKITQFRFLCMSNYVPNHVKITVARTNLFEDSFNEVMRKNAVDLRRKLYIHFRGEDGLDYGGIAREWFFELSHAVLNPMSSLFMYANSTNYSLQINPASFVNPDHLKYFEFIGRFIAMALFHNKFIYAGFTMPFYKKMLNKKLTMKDLESVDEQFFKSAEFIMDNNIDDCELDLFFVADYELLGEVKTHELKEGGTDIAVTEENKEEYITLLVDWRFNRGIEEQMKSFFTGFNSVLPIEWLQYFDERELELLLCGMQAIDVDDWERHTVYRHYAPNSKQVTWFWQFVRSLDSEKRARLLQFVTGTCRVPVGGFAELMGSTGPQMFCIERAGKENYLPRSHTCFNRLDLPLYKTQDQLIEKLTRAIQETEGFGNE